MCIACSQRVCVFRISKNALLRKQLLDALNIQRCAEQSSELGVDFGNERVCDSHFRQSDLLKRGDKTVLKCATVPIGLEPAIAPEFLDPEVAGA